MSDFLSLRAWIIFIGVESVLAGVLWMIGLVSPIVLIAFGVCLLFGLWMWENRREWLSRTLTLRRGILHAATDDSEVMTTPSEWNALADRWPIGTELTVEHDGFKGTVQGYYVTREGHPGLVLQLHDARVVHVYRERWFK